MVGKMGCVVLCRCGSIAHLITVTAGMGGLMCVVARVDIFVGVSENTSPVRTWDGHLALAGPVGGDRR